MTQAHSAPTIERDTIALLRQDRLDEVIDRYGQINFQGGGIGQISNDTERYVLIERHDDEELWSSLHTTTEEAGDYYANQDHVEDWHVLELIDLDTGARFEPRQSLRWIQVAAAHA